MKSFIYFIFTTLEKCAVLNLSPPLSSALPFPNIISSVIVFLPLHFITKPLLVNSSDFIITSKNFCLFLLGCVGLLFFMNTLIFQLGAFCIQYTKHVSSLSPHFFFYLPFFFRAKEFSSLYKQERMLHSQN